MRQFMTGGRVAFLVSLFVFANVRPVMAAPEGTLTWGVHVTLAARWLDPAETEGLITPFMVFYAIHDALVKPMPAGPNTPSLAESWAQSKDGLTYEFVLRRGAKLHNGDPVTAERAAFYAAWREKKLRGLFLTAAGNSSNAASRVEAFIYSKGSYAYGGYPDIDDLFQQQARERDTANARPCSIASSNSPSTG
jgi:ABC-type transport system substrate-binding protein